MNWYDEENLNNVTREHFEKAINLASKCKPEGARLKPKVGCVIVKNGMIITSSFRNQTGSGDHAEFIALEHSGLAKAEFNGADLITTLEPCTTRSHGSVKKPCVDWILLRNISKVWVGTLDYNPNITGRSIIKLQDRGIKLGWFPADLKLQILEQNREFFNHILQAQPKISRQELKDRLEEIKTYTKEELDHVKNLRLEVTVAYQEQVERAKNLGYSVLLDALSHTLLMDVESYHDWTNLGLRFSLAQSAGEERSRKEEPLSIWIGLPPLVLSGMSYLAASNIDASNPKAWIGLAKAQLGINNGAQAFDTLEKSLKYLDRPNAEYALLFHDIAKHTLSKPIEPEPILLEMCIWTVLRSLEQGVNIDDIVETIKQLISFKLDDYTNLSITLLEQIAKIVGKSSSVIGLSDEIGVLVKAIQTKK